MPLPPDPRQAIQSARRDHDLAVLEGLHALKHALRFGAEILRVVMTNPEAVRELIDVYAPDLPDLLRDAVEPEIVSPEVFRALSPNAPPTGVITIARRPEIDLDVLLADSHAAPVVLLEDPRDLGNIGACVRVAAAADVAGLVTTGVHDPWSPAALRGSAGLHFALPVVHSSAAPPGGNRPLVAVDAEGEQLHPAQLPPRSILAFGSERRGLSDALLARADARVSLPMRAGVSSLNLATSVAALLYAWRFASEADPASVSRPV